jgi:hypothetical protein
MGLPTKKGRQPAFSGIQLSSGTAVTLRVSNDGEIHVSAKNATDLERIVNHADRDESYGIHAFGINLKLDPPKREMSRLLAKMALERAYVDFAKASPPATQLIFDPYFDHLRQWARVGDNFSEWPFHQRTIYPREALMRHPQTGAWVRAGISHGLFHTDAPETYFSICLYGTEFVINAGGPNVEGFDNWLEQHNNESPYLLYEGYRLTAREGAIGTIYCLDKRTL